jgi:pSer/pThr/pTyr-binding forkhead associated (FHA) protein
MGNIIFKTILGIIAGVVGWALVEPFKPQIDTPAWSVFETALMLAWGVFIGGAVGFHSGLNRGSRVHAFRELALGVIFGSIGILIGRGLSSPFVGLINMPGVGIMGRAIVFCIFGAGIGAGVGFSTFVPRRALQGLIGGAIGGAIAGFLFDIVGATLAGITLVAQGVEAGKVGEVGGPARGLTAAILGGCIALMIGIIEALAKSAWIRLELGRNEGKEWVIDKPTFMIGRHERADIPLFGDTNVAPQHAAIHKQGANYTVVDQGTPMGIGVNGQRVSQAVLRPNDVIQIGGMSLRFITKNVKAPRRDPEAMRNMAYSLGGPQAQVQMLPGQMPGQPLPMHPAALNAGGMQPTIMNSQPAPNLGATQVVSQGGMVPTQMYGQPAMAGGFVLVAMDGPIMGQRFPMTMPLELGRESAQVPMAFDGSSSRRHARVEVSGPLVNVSDLGSTNGTFLNGQRITNATAKNGDILKVGAISFRIESQ